MSKLKNRVIGVIVALAFMPCPATAVSFITDPISSPSTQWAGIDYWGVQVSQFSTLDQTLFFEVPDDSKIDIFMQGSSKFQFNGIFLNGQSIAGGFTLDGSISPIAMGYASAGPVSLRFTGDYNCPACWGDWFGGYVQVTKASIPESTSFLAVPEPASWATMIIGFGLLGFMIRRRKPKWLNRVT